MLTYLFILPCMLGYNFKEVLCIVDSFNELKHIYSNLFTVGLFCLYVLKKDSAWDVNIGEDWNWCRLLEVWFFNVLSIRTNQNILWRVHVLKGKISVYVSFLLSGGCYHSVRKECYNNRNTERFKYRELVDSAIIYNLSYLILVNKGSDPWRRFFFEFLCLSLN